MDHWRLEGDSSVSPAPVSDFFNARLSINLNTHLVAAVILAIRGFGEEIEECGEGVELKSFVEDVRSWRTLFLANDSLPRASRSILVSNNGRGSDRKFTHTEGHQRGKY